MQWAVDMHGAVREDDEVHLVEVKGSPSELPEGASSSFEYRVARQGWPSLSPCEAGRLDCRGTMVSLAVEMNRQNHAAAKERLPPPDPLTCDLTPKASR